jgi:hypothetical protein
MNELIAEWLLKLQEREYHAVLTAAVLAVAACFGYTPDGSTTATVVGALAVFVAYILNRAMIKKAAIEQRGKPRLIIVDDSKESEGELEVKGSKSYGTLH